MPPTKAYVFPYVLSTAAERSSMEHRPSVTFGFASAPARLPSATRNPTHIRSPAVASGRLGGLPSDRCTLLRHALPEDCQVGHFADRNLTPTAKCRTWTRPTAAPLLEYRGERESRSKRSTRHRAPVTAGAGETRDGCRASAGRSPGGGRSILFQRCPAPARAMRRTSDSNSDSDCGRGSPDRPAARPVSSHVTLSELASRKVPYSRLGNQLRFSATASSVAVAVTVTETGDRGRFGPRDCR
jgi:hypothetical protein